MSKNARKIKKIMMLFDLLSDPEQEKALKFVKAINQDLSASRKVASSCSKT